MESIKYDAGVSDETPSLAGAPRSAIETGFVKAQTDNHNPWEPNYQPQLDDGTNLVGDRWEFSKTGACGRPDGNER